jgi:hypothetical protein
MIICDPTGGTGPEITRIELPITEKSLMSPSTVKNI